MEGRRAGHDGAMAMGGWAPIARVGPINTPVSRFLQSDPVVRLALDRRSTIAQDDRGIQDTLLASLS